MTGGSSGTLTLESPRPQSSHLPPLSSSVLSEAWFPHLPDNTSALTSVRSPQGNRPKHWHLLGDRRNYHLNAAIGKHPGLVTLDWEAQPTEPFKGSDEMLRLGGLGKLRA